MKIISIVENKDGSAVATIADDSGNIIGFNEYSPESLPRPRLTEEEE
jgi:hypothetical protein